ncbi:GntR family transcriptional regulator [Shewanella sp. OPT22]|uniref:GntR family transcriptional regulator n=1 Tax=Parashewanella hymeniacidonis TaxID=2807618 RepID=UPI0010219DFA|nr:GntR family transcriptional regulator [Parashewanella hymeniacidonis]MBM7073889.1 GntR family transcriptional regulator [Parashewanella hymeniacidonis]RYV04049.1 GntR family transcriptional regulator [Shewanella sp. OPT22]
MSQTTPIVHKTRTQVVVEVLREKILSGEIAAGEPLRQSALAESLNVSRIPVREALLQLEAEGLVKFEAHKGATATKLSVEQVAELFELRSMIETDLLIKAIPNLSTEDFLEAEQVLELLESAFKKENAVASWSELNTQFHTCLYQAANRPHTLEVVQGLNTNCDRYIRLQLLLGGGIPKAEHEHRELLNYCKIGNTEKAAELLKHHILNAAETIKQLVAQQVK